MKCLVALACLFAVGVLATPAQAGVGVNVGVGVPLYAPHRPMRLRPRTIRHRLITRRRLLPTRLRLPASMWRRPFTSDRGTTAATATVMVTATADVGTASS